MTDRHDGHRIVRALAIIALVLVGAGIATRGAAAQPGPIGEPIPSPQPVCGETRPDLVITSARLGYDSLSRQAYLDVVVKNRSSCARAGAFYVSHRTEDHPTTLQSVYVSGLGAGVSRTVRFSNAPQCGYWETLRGRLTADSRNQVAERIEGNNYYDWHHVC